MAKKTKKSRKNSKPNVFKQTTATNSTIDTNTESSIVAVSYTHLTLPTTPYV